MKRFILTFCLVIAFGFNSYAQSRSLASPSPRKKLNTVIFAGLGGAVLGLSTLSFHGRPQDHMDDIAIGFVVGLIAGFAYTTYEAAYGADASKDHPFDRFHYISQRPAPSFRVLSLNWDF